MTAGCSPTRCTPRSACTTPTAEWCPSSPRATVSGGHTQLMRVEGIGRYLLLGETQDDAAGEAFDKTAKLLGLGYPGGPALWQLAQSGTPGRYRLPRPMIGSGDLEFSFSGLKTAVVTLAKQAAPAAHADIARAFVDAVVEVLVAKCVHAMELSGLTRLVVAGGVGANRQLRSALGKEAEQRGFDLFYPQPELCTDNGAMIAFAAAQRLRQGQDGAEHAFSVRPRWDIEAEQHARRRRDALAALEVVKQRKKMTQKYREPGQRRGLRRIKLGKPDREPALPRVSRQRESGHGSLSGAQDVGRSRVPGAVGPRIG